MALLLAVRLPAYAGPGVQTPAPDPHRWNVLLHAHAHVSEGREDYLVDLQRGASEAGIDAVILTEHLFAQWEISLPVIRSFAAWEVSRPSMARFGLRDFYRLTAAADQKVPGVTLIVGAEVAPYYRWEFPDTSGGLTMWDWQRNLLVLGLGPGDLNRLPVFGLHHPLASTHGVLWLLVVLVLGAGFLVLLNRMRWIRAAAAGVPLALLLWSGPPASGAYSIYGPDPGIAPWQALIDSAEARGAFTMWTQVESPDDESFGRIHIRTSRHPGVLVQSRRYDAWGAINPDRMQALLPGAEWDQALRAAMADPDRGVPWGWGEIALHYPEQLTIKSLDQVLSVLWAPSRDPSDLLEALRTGHGYAVWSTQAGTRLQLDSFAVLPPDGGTPIRSGGRCSSPGPYTVTAAWSSDGPIQEPVTARLIRDGNVVNVQTDTGSGHLSVHLPDGTGTGYVRLELRSRSHLLLSNPILVEGGGTP